MKWYHLNFPRELYTMKTLHNAHPQHQAKLNVANRLANDSWSHFPQY